VTSRAGHVGEWLRPFSCNNECFQRRREFCRRQNLEPLAEGERRRSSVGESARLIIERSAVRVCPPLHQKPGVESGKTKE
jgi:hypothetical protein